MTRLKETEHFTGEFLKDCVWTVEEGYQILSMYQKMVTKTGREFFERER